MAYSKERLVVDSDQRELLTRWSQAPTTPQQVAKRCRIVLLSEAGWPDQRIAGELKLNRHKAEDILKRSNDAENAWKRFNSTGSRSRRTTEFHNQCARTGCHAIIVMDLLFSAEITRDYYPDLTTEDVRACVQHAIDVLNAEEIHVQAA